MRDSFCLILPDLKTYCLQIEGGEDRHRYASFRLWRIGCVSTRLVTTETEALAVWRGAKQIAKRPIFEVGNVEAIGNEAVAKLTDQIFKDWRKNKIIWDHGIR